MARCRRHVGLEAIRKQIEAAQEEAIKKKHEYDVATDRLKNLLDKEKEIQTEVLMAAIMTSERSYDEIIQYIKSKPEYE